MTAQAKETPEVLGEVNEAFDLMIGDSEVEIPELPESNTTCEDHFYCF
jgi:hypothetical protein